MIIFVLFITFTFVCEYYDVFFARNEYYDVDVVRKIANINLREIYDCTNTSGSATSVTWSDQVNDI